MEATAGAAPGSGAGTASGDRSAQTQSPTGNSAGKNSPDTQQGPGARQPSSTQNQDSATRDSARDSNGRDSNGRFQSANPAPAQDDDPEFDFGERGKFKRSRVVQDFQRMQASQKAEAKARADLEKRMNMVSEALQKFGLDPDALVKDPQNAFEARAQAYIQRKLEEATLTPEQIEARQRDERLKTAEERLAEYEKQQEQEKQSAAVNARAQEYAQNIHQALDQAGLPRNPKTIARMAELMLAAARTKSRLLPHELAQRVAEQVYEEQGAHAQSFGGNVEAMSKWFQPYLSPIAGDGAKLAQLLGPDAVESLRKHILKEAESKFSPQKQRNARDPQIFESNDHPNGYHTLDDWNSAQLRKRAQRK